MAFCSLGLSITSYCAKRICQTWLWLAHIQYNPYTLVLNDIFSWINTSNKCPSRPSFTSFYRVVLLAAQLFFIHRSSECSRADQRPGGSLSDFPTNMWYKMSWTEAASYGSIRGWLGTKSWKGKKNVHKSAQTTPLVCDVRVWPAGNSKSFNMRTAPLWLASCLMAFHNVQRLCSLDLSLRCIGPTVVSVVFILISNRVSSTENCKST